MPTALTEGCFAIVKETGKAVTCDIRHKAHISGPYTWICSDGCEYTDEQLCRITADEYDDANA